MNVLVFHRWITFLTQTVLLPHEITVPLFKLGAPAIPNEAIEGISLNFDIAS
jgi:hypothetical protein